MYLCEFESSLVDRVSSGQPELQSGTLSQRKEREKERAGLSFCSTINQLKSQVIVKVREFGKKNK